MQAAAEFSNDDKSSSVDTEQNNEKPHLKSSYIPRIVDIYFGLKDYSNIKILKKIRGLEKDLIEYRIEL
jgi:hypothetical protein